MYTALYRAERPEVFSEILGQEHIVKILKYQINSGSVSHAYLFCGTRGTGKTTTARLLAKAVNCLSDGDRPCGSCANCEAIKNGTFMDVVEIDAASNNGVESIRELRESVKYPPAIGRKKVYIIDEVHMLSTGAFNALLKTLEEPPENVMFILATTEPQKLPATILSRCMRLDFKRVPLNTLADGMRRICRDKGIDITEGAVKLLANSADGSVRDGLSILDQVLAAGDKFIDREKVLEYIGTAGEDFFIELTDLVALHNVAEAIVLLDKALADGKDVKQLMKDWTGHYRSLLLTKFIKNPEDMLNMSAENIEKIREQSQQISLEEINNAIIRLSKTINDARWSTQPRILLELAIVAIATDLIDEDRPMVRRTVVQPMQTMQTMQTMQPAVSVPAPVMEPASGSVHPQMQSQMQPQLHPQMQQEVPMAAPAGVNAAGNSEVKQEVYVCSCSNAVMSNAEADRLWHKIFEEGEGSAGSFNLIRTGTTLMAVEDGKFIVGAKTGFAKRYAEKLQTELERLMTIHTGKPMKMICKMEEDVQQTNDDKFESIAKEASQTLGINIEIE